MVLPHPGKDDADRGFCLTILSIYWMQLRFFVLRTRLVPRYRLGNAPSAFRVDCSPNRRLLALLRAHRILMENRRDKQLLDAEGFRPNVGIIITDGAGRLLWARRHRQDSWQFPQGGMHAGETPEQTMFRELYEEVGLTPATVSILGCSRGWLRYRLPRRLLRHDTKPLCVGQKQKWFLLKLTGPESAVRFDTTDHPEFDHWQWVSYWYPLRHVVSFKRDVYRRALRELMPLVLGEPIGEERDDERRSRERRRPRHRRNPSG